MDTLTFRLKPLDRVAFETAAKRKGWKLSHWLRQSLYAEANRQREIAVKNRARKTKKPATR